jgi:hypothetical protein
MAGDMNVGVGTGDKADTVTSVCCMVNTFNEFSWFWEIGETSDRSCLSAGVHLLDWRADVCSLRDTGLTLMLVLWSVLSHRQRQGSKQDNAAPQTNVRHG